MRSGFSINKFFNALKSRGVAVGKERLHEYLAQLEDTFLLTSICIASESERRRQVNPRKIYPVDTGLMALFDAADQPHTGHALETMVLHECLRRDAQVPTGGVALAAKMAASPTPVVQ